MTTHKLHYITPTSETMELRMQQMLCLSQTQNVTPQFGDTWVWDGQ